MSGLEFKSDNTIKSKAMKYIFKNRCLNLLHIKKKETYCVICKKNVVNEIPLSNFAFCDKEKLQFIKSQEIHETNVLIK